MSLPPEPKYYVQTSGALVETQMRYTGDLTGPWVKASDYRVLRAAAEGLAQRNEQLINAAKLRLSHGHNTHCAYMLMAGRECTCGTDELRVALERGRDE